MGTKDKNKNKSELTADMEKLRKRVGKLKRAADKNKKVETDLRARLALLEKLFDSVPGAIVLCNNEGVILRTNQEFGRVFGYTPDETAGRRVDDLIAPNENHDFAVSVTEGVVEGKKYSFEAERIHKNGTPIQVSCVALPIIVDESQVAVYANYRDIADRIKREEDLKIKTAYLDHLFNSAPFGIAMSNADHKLMRVNKGFTDIFGYPGEEVIGRHIDDLVAPVDLLAEAIRATEKAKKSAMP